AAGGGAGHCPLICRAVTATAETAASAVTLAGGRRERSGASREVVLVIGEPAVGLVAALDA
ncbi:hypothetical protein ACFXJJ_17985, partial [Streptomyces sp. NPDC059233]